MQCLLQLSLTFAIAAVKRRYPNQAFWDLCSVLFMCNFQSYGRVLPIFAHAVSMVNNCAGYHHDGSDINVCLLQ